MTGVGYWSGRTNTVEFRPAAAGTGIVFVHRGRGDAVIPASITARVDAQRRTNLSAGGASVEMVEHVLAALAALEIDNCRVYVTSDEMPGCDGSSLMFTEALVAAGITAQDASTNPLIVTGFHRIGDASRWIEVRPPSSPGLTIQYELDFPECPPIGHQIHRLTVTPESFRTELASARTFIRDIEAEALTRRGVATHVQMTDLLVFDDTGPIGNCLRYEDECVRHKILDLVGDLSLAGRPIHAEIAAYRSGHNLNADVTSAILAADAASTDRRQAA